MWRLRVRVGGRRGGRRASDRKAPAFPPLLSLPPLKVILGRRPTPLPHTHTSHDTRAYDVTAQMNTTPL